MPVEIPLTTPDVLIDPMPAELLLHTPPVVASVRAVVEPRQTLAVPLIIAGEGLTTGEVV